MSILGSPDSVPNESSISAVAPAADADTRGCGAEGDIG
jgi:hypothetical protein